MRSHMFILFALFFGSTVHASDYGDHNCNIFVVDAQNVITGTGNFISATVAVSNQLIAHDFHNYQVKIAGYENATPTKTLTVGNMTVFQFERYRRGVEYHGSDASVQAYITNGIDRLFDNNEPAYLSFANNWKFINHRCKI